MLCDVTMSESVKSLREILNKVAKVGVLTPNVKVSASLEYPSFNEVDVPKLDELVKVGLLKKKIIDRAVSCPKCGSLALSTRYVCPSCSSVNIEKSRLIQHINCGYTDSEIKFPRNESGNLLCPKCGNEISDEKQLRIYATFFECLTCHSRTSTPNIMYRCHKCDNMFKSSDASLKPLHSYELTDKGLSIAMQEKTS